MEKRRLGPCITFFPQPATVISSRDGAGAANLMTASWVSLVSKTPPTIGVALHRDRRTCAIVRESGCFVVNVMPAALAAETDFCGLRSGRDTDKAAVTGLTLLPAERVSAPLVAEAPLNLECRLAEEVEIGDYRLLLGEILEVHAAAAAFDAEGKADIRVFDPLVFLGGIREYWRLGEKAGTAYRDGLHLVEGEG